ncbi:MAG: hypothetical protein FWC89_11200 [Defluviitaleaceae bacterium]|nr:hypothetical protein [Defluviitaleaceae bacterium]
MNALVSVLSIVGGWLFTAVLVTASLVLHEWAHVFAVKFMGGKVEKISVFPLGLMAKVRGLENLHAWERYVIYAAGPIANLAISLWALGVSRISYTGVGWLDELAFYSLVIGIFNLTPALPLDGGRIALQFLGNRIGLLRANRIIILLGVIVSYFFLGLGIVQVILFPFNISLLMAAIFIKWKNKSIATELEAAFYRAMEGKNHQDRARNLPVIEIEIPSDTQIKQALERLAGDYFITFLVDGHRHIREQQLIHHVFTRGISGTIGDVSQLKLTQQSARIS